MSLGRKTDEPNSTEDFWNSSNISTFSFDDAAQFAQLRESIAATDLDDVTSNFSGESDNIVNDIGYTSSTVALNSDKVHFQNSIPRSIPSDALLDKSSNLSSPVMSSARLDASRSHHRTNSATSSGGLSFVGDDSVVKSVDYSRLESEYNKLKLKFEQMRRDKYKPADVKETVHRLMNCEPCTLDSYKSLSDKLSLLSAAVKLADGNAITAVLLFLRQTLSYALFQEQLLQNSLIANHYVTYLRDHYKYDELITTLFSIGRKEEAALIEFNQAVKKREPNTKVQKMRQSIQSTFSIDPSLTGECQVVVEYCDLLERQMPIESSDTKIIAENKENVCKLFKQFPKTTSIVDQPLLVTLYYCSLYHYELPINSNASPLSIRAHYQLSDKQYCWVSIKALARQKRWLEIEKLLTSKNIFGATRLKSPIAYDKLLTVLSQQGATPEILSIYVRQISENDKKLELAEKFQCHQVVVDCLVVAKDRQALISYRSKLTSHTQAAHYADSAIQNSNFKWKN